MSKRAVLIAGALAVIVAFVFVVTGVPGASQSPGPEAQRDHIAAVEPAPQRSDAPASASPVVARVDHKRQITPEERRNYRKRILEGLRGSHPSTTAAAAPPNDDAPQKSGDIQDRSGGSLSQYIETINDDFMPLADECYGEAVAAEPELAGMLEMHVEIIADETVGGLVESVDFGPANELTNPDFLQCMRETMLSTIFAAPEHTGRDRAALTLVFAPDEE